VWFQFEQLEPSLAKIEQLFQTLWICALHGQAALAPHNPWLVGRGIADIAFLLQAHRFSIWCAVAYLDPVLGWSIAKAGGEEGSCADTLFRFTELSQASRSVSSYDYR
jgi:hypothetical protein